MSEAKEYKYIGQRSIRPDGFDKVTGRANFGADLDLPGMIWGKILRSPHAHARIKNIDTSKAEAVDGVLAIARYQDFPSVGSGSVTAGEATAEVGDLARNILAEDKVLYHGHAILGIAALTEAIAERAVDLVEIEYEVLDHVLDVSDAIAPGAPVLHSTMMTQGLAEEPTEASNVATRAELVKGDVDAGFAEADIIVERDYYTPTVHQGYIEPHACTATYDEDGQSMVWWYPGSF